MELLKNFIFEGLSFEIIKEGMSIFGFDKRFAITLRIINSIDKKTDVKLKATYFSTSKGLLEFYAMAPQLDNGVDLLDNSFVDVKIGFTGIKNCIDGDRMEMEIETDSSILSLVIKRGTEEWIINDYAIKYKTTSYELKKRIEHYEELELKYGIVLQNFSVLKKGKKSLDIYYEVYSIDEELRQLFPKIHFNVIVFDMDNNVVHMHGFNIYNSDYNSFDVLELQLDHLRIPISEISKIKIIPAV